LCAGKGAECVSGFRRCAKQAGLYRFHLILGLYPWCAQYGGGEEGGGRNCGFSTLEQCRATISGIGGFCEPNLFYPGSASDTSQRKRKRQH
jgi:Protein of unknown function (DUF3551)